MKVDVAIVGGGPAGLGAAMALRKAGIERVVVIEREPEAGGVPRHCGHPAFGMREFGRLMSGPSYARALVRRAVQAGVEILTRHSVVALQPEGRLMVANPAGSLEIVARRVVLATGAREMSRAARLVGGDRPLGVMNTGALQAYIYLQGLAPFRRPVIVGTELVSLSSIWTCMAHGIRPQAIVTGGDQAVARWPLGFFPHLLGIPVHYRAQVQAIGGVGRVESVAVVREGRGAVEIACDGVLLTGQFIPESSLARLSHIVVDRASGGPAVDQVHRCSDPVYFATGNLLRGIETAGWCHREGLALGKRVAEDLARDRPKGAQVSVSVSAPFKFSVPQRLAADVASAPDLQLRLTEPVSGTLVVESGGRALYRRPLRSRPERRILVPIQHLAGAREPITIRIE
ncbi:pyridine nucleotide-disulfide oxidoreductase [Devosia riboflavina]|uniref:Pyridine nucleotide-disulfide oxidoreductase n=1 Tax=Devosia riboflavina TaxID=46914 RepID=A0A087M323_9HYPH|nr:FAD/NAD(P)-binding oxidoreductase [Devosia riboflavina]KFL31276.1 pyridine nucleotide-disulfide oxidoreductase [Devosia riboflavina]